MHSFCHWFLSSVWTACGTLPAPRGVHRWIEYIDWRCRTFQFNSVAWLSRALYARSWLAYWIMSSNYFDPTLEWMTRTRAISKGDAYGDTLRSVHDADRAEKGIEIRWHACNERNNLARQSKKDQERRPCKNAMRCFRCQKPGDLPWDCPGVGGRDKRRNYSAGLLP